MRTLFTLIVPFAALWMGACSADPQVRPPIPTETDVRGTPPPPWELPVVHGPDAFSFEVQAPSADAAGDTHSLVGPVIRECVATFRYVAPPGETVTSVHVPGSFNGWSQQDFALEEVDAGVFEGTLALEDLAAGSVSYKLLLNGEQWVLDGGNPMKIFHDGVVNSKLRVPDCNAPTFHLLERSVDAAQGSAVLRVQLQRGLSGAWGPESVQVHHNFERVELPVDASGTLEVAVDHLPPGKHTWRFDALHEGKPIQPMVVSFWVEASEFQWRDAALYFAFVDRFQDALPNPPSLECGGGAGLSDWMGGDWPGLEARIKAGYFEELGVNTLWINAAVDNPEECVSGLGGHLYAAYHGYFPENLLATEPRFGSLSDLKSLVKTAHARGLRVVMDLVANHVYQTAQEWTDHEFDGWFNTPMFLCGWEQPETCWFQSYMPDLNHRNDDVVEHIVDTALYWAVEADLDGFRVDAVKHIHRHFLHTLRHRLQEEVESYSSIPFWLVGETFTGSWGGGEGSEELLIKSYVDDTQLHGQFDFPLYWALLESVGRHESGLDTLATFLVKSQGYYGQNALMASFLGNHDVPRFISHAAGDIQDLWGQGSLEQAWDAPPPSPDASQPYARLKQAFTLLAGLPSIPLIYYGDEVALPGAGDPDNRRPMVFSGLSALQSDVLAHTQKVFKTRQASVALRRGPLSVLFSSPDVLCFLRTHGDSSAIVVVNRGDESVSIDLDSSVTGSFQRLDGSLYTSAEALVLAGGASDILVQSP